MYEKMEEVLQIIHKEFISLNIEEVEDTTKLLKETLIKLTEYMREEDKIFRKIFNGFYFGGSFYHNLKVKKPDEFDIDILFVLPKCETCRVKNCRCISIRSSHNPEYLIFTMEENCCTAVYRKFCRNGYMQTNLIYNWMKSLVYKALNRLKAERAIYSFLEDYVFRDKEIMFYTECAPALKICVEGKFGMVYIDIAAAFKLNQMYWPGPDEGYRQNSTSKKYFSIVPMSPQGMTNYWRPSFQAQEKEIIAKKERLKPALRLLKMMRNNLNHKISSYMLKTLILEEANKYEWKDESLSDTFMILLEKYIDCLHQKRISYFWVRETNLLEGLKFDTLLNHHNEIKKLYKKIQREYTTNPTVVAEVILKKGSEEYNKFIEIRNHPKGLRTLCSNLSLLGIYDNDDDSSSYNLENDFTSFMEAITRWNHFGRVV